MTSVTKTPKNHKRGMTKICVVCGADFPARGRDRTCSPECSKEWKRQWTQQYLTDNRGRKRQYDKQWYAANRERKSQSSREYHSTPEYRERRRKYNQKRQKDPVIKERLRESHKQWCANNRERLREYDRKRYAIPERREKKRQYHKRYQTEHLEQCRIRKANRKARKRELPATLTSEQWQFALNYFHGCCAVCGRQLNDMFGEFSAAQDHWVPLSYESEDNPGSVAENIVPLCHGIDGCNNSKHNTMPGVWLRRNYSERKAKQIERRIADYFNGRRLGC